MKRLNFQKGRAGEKEAREYLEQRGLFLIETNFRCQVGEIDLIMTDKDWLVFVEVKYKADDRMGLPEEMIDRRKIAQIKRVAEWYLVENEERGEKFQKYRIDGVCVLGTEIRHYKNIGE